jgi:hypothetical protein
MKNCFYLNEINLGNIYHKHMIMQYLVNFDIRTNKLYKVKPNRQIDHTKSTQAKTFAS